MKRAAALALIAGLALASTLPAWAAAYPKKVTATCYTESGRKTATGSTKESGIIAARAEDLGAVAIVYKVADDGGIGECLGMWMVEDVGYGRATGEGESGLIEGRTQGTIEAGETVDFRQETYSDCLEFMRLTQTGKGSSGSQVWVQIIKGRG